ncbi:GMP reductase 1-like, partial [Branchiostoma floridae]|uniref:GMP reductase n=1 Tax=Branchiostoma floridae TaxID=7739 RepID=A0A9J7KT98_BRAFL
MPRIEADVKLDFKDVLIRPKRSTLRSRSDVELVRTISKFRNSGQSYSGIPVIAANMDTVGTFEMAKALSKHGCFTTIHKHYSVEAWEDFGRNNPDVLQHVAVSAGSLKGDFDKLTSILTSLPQLKFICLDVANGYSEAFVETVREVRKKFPKHTIMVSLKFDLFLSVLFYTFS